MVTPFLALPTTLAEWGRIAAVALLVALATAPLAYCEGKGNERDAWEAKVAVAEKAAAERARAADEARRASLAKGNDAITRNREELDNETANLPDESPSARRRARYCRELRAQARASGVADPAC